MSFPLFFARWFDHAKKLNLFSSTHIDHGRSYSSDCSRSTTEAPLAWKLTTPTSPPPLPVEPPPAASPISRTLHSPKNITGGEEIPNYGTKEKEIFSYGKESILDNHLASPLQSPQAEPLEITYISQYQVKETELCVTRTEPPFLEELEPANVIVVRGQAFELCGRYVETSPGGIQARWLKDKMALVPGTGLEINMTILHYMAYKNIQNSSVLGI